MAELHHECGIAAVFQRSAAGEPARMIAQMLHAMQNRGQQAAGISVAYEGSLRTHKRLGRVQHALSDMAPMPGRAAIGHVRYATCGANELRFAQPFERKHADPRQSFALAFSGQLANFAALRHEIPALRNAECDTEVLVHLIAHGLDASRDLVAIFRELVRRLDGAFNLVFLNGAGEVVVLRDPTGIRPLCWAQNEDHFAAASESYPLTQLAFRDVRSLAPGELILVGENETRIERFTAPQPIAHCFFEWIYFANRESVLDAVRVAAVRERLGARLAAQEKLTDHANIIVVPVPNTARHAAAAMAEQLHLPLVHAMEANDEVGRTFIEGSHRGDTIRRKFTFRADLLSGRRVILVEDTLIRGTTLKWLIKELREQCNVAEVHVRIACPPIIAPCYYGIDIASTNELFAPKFAFREGPSLSDFEKMAQALGADSLAYLPLEAITQAIDLPPSRICQACTTGVYPTTSGQKLYDLEVRQCPKSNGQASNAAVAKRPCNR